MTTTTRAKALTALAVANGGRKNRRRQRRQAWRPDLNRPPLLTSKEKTMSDYNGWKNYETWNVNLWIQNDESLSSIAFESESYKDFVDTMRELGSLETPDRVAWNDSGIDVDEINESNFNREESETL